MKLNLNTTVRAILTDAGATQYNNIYARYGCILQEPNATVECELWRLMADFGPVIAMALPIPFKDNSIEILENE